MDKFCGPVCAGVGGTHVQEREREKANQKTKGKHDPVRNYPSYGN